MFKPVWFLFLIISYCVQSTSQSETKGNKNQNRFEKLETKTNLNHNIHCVFQKVDKRVLKLGVADYFT